jgi:23S rRNA (pseudouridine1915-N3)-methyltransferase
MKIRIIQFGKSHFPFVDEGFEVFAKRLKHYCKLEVMELTLPSKYKSAEGAQVKKLEGEMLLGRLAPAEYVVLLDEKGGTFNSKKWAGWIEKQSLHHAAITFVIGGAFGFSEEVYTRANAKLSLSSMTFSHQLIRLIFAEQLYRAFTIIKGEPYHNE